MPFIGSKLVMRQLLRVIYQVVDASFLEMFVRYYWFLACFSSSGDCLINKSGNPWALDKTLWRRKITLKPFEKNIRT